MNNKNYLLNKEGDRHFFIYLLTNKNFLNISFSPLVFETLPVDILPIHTYTGNKLEI